MTSKAARAASVTATTPASTLIRSWARATRRRRSLRRIVVLRTGQPQAVTDGVLRVNHVRSAARQLAPQVDDIRGDDLARTVEFLVPHVGEELGVGEYPAG